jgi:hypothetical protein
MKFIEKHWLWILGIAALGFIPYTTSDGSNASFWARLQGSVGNSGQQIFPWS